MCQIHLIRHPRRHTALHLTFARVREALDASMEI
jgi:hypothetical protein